MQGFDDFIKAQGLDSLAQAYFAQRLNNPAITLAELRDILNESSVQKFLPNMTLGSILAPTQAHKVTHRDERSNVANEALAFLKNAPSEYHDAEDISSAIGSSPQYINQVLQAGFKDNTMPIMMTRRSNARGLGTPVYRYIEGMDTSA